MLLASDNQSLDLNGWVTLNNTSGGAYTDAQVKLVAGDVNRLPSPQSVANGRTLDMVAEAAAAPPAVQQRDVSEYKPYDISRRVPVGPNATKQAEFVTAAGAGAHTFCGHAASPP